VKLSMAAVAAAAATTFSQKKASDLKIL